MQHRLKILPALVIHTARAMSWRSLLPLAIPIAVLAGLITRQPLDLAARHFPMRLGFAVSALWLLFAFDDAAAEMTDTTPTRLWVRRAIRLVLTVVPWIVSIVALLGATSWADETNRRLALPFARLGIEAITVGILGLAIASGIARQGNQQPGQLASLSILSLVGVSWLIPQPASPWQLPTSSSWNAAAWWWLSIFGLSLLVAVSYSFDTRAGVRKHLRGVV